jgi:hypothetical protein
MACEQQLSTQILQFEPCSNPTSFSANVQFLKVRRGLFLRYSEEDTQPVLNICLPFCPELWASI